MFINLNTNETYDYKYIAYRFMKYGRDDLGDQKQFFKWSDSLEDFLAVCGNHLNEFIDDCKNDPIDLLEGSGLKYVSDLGFPNAHDFAYRFPNEFCQLVLDYHLDTVLPPYFFNEHREILKFVINSVDSVAIENGNIILTGTGFIPYVISNTTQTNPPEK